MIAPPRRIRWPGAGRWSGAACPQCDFCTRSGGRTCAGSAARGAASERAEAEGEIELRKDGRLMNDLVLYEVKKPAESKGEWDLYKPLKRIPASAVYRPLDKSECPIMSQM